jgi:hypothetical protein
MNENIKAGSDIHAGDGGYSLGTQEKYDEFVKGRNQSLGKMRIRELAEQAGASMLHGGELSFFGNTSIEKFAELIIEECARVARATPAPNFHEHLKQQLGHTWDMAASEAGREIVKHFGVEE